MTPAPYPFNQCDPERTLRTSALEVTELVVVTEPVQPVAGVCVALPAGVKTVRKTIAAQPGLGGAYRTLFLATQEGKRFQHLPAVYAFAVDDQAIHVLVEYVDGVTLLEHVEAEGASLQTARLLFPAVCDAVTELHAFNPPIIHRDLKPSNVMVRTDGTVTLIDFGIARRFQKGAPDDTTHFGTRSFAPPEQFGFKQTDQRSDVYALGCLLAFCLTGTIPGQAGEAPGRHAACLPPELEKVVKRATAFDPGDRYASARKLKQAFSDAASRDAAKMGSAVSASLTAGKRRLVAASHVGGRVWNVVLLLLAALLTAGSIAAGLQSPLPDQSLPQWACAAAYFVFMPALFASFAWALWDKRRIMLGRKRPWLAKTTGAWSLFGYVCVGFIVFVALVGVIT